MTAKTPTKRWKLRHPERSRESHRIAQQKWRAKNKERVRERTKRWRAANRDKVNACRRKQHFKQNYGITIEARDQMLAGQGGCALCAGTEPGNKIGWVVDHCHASGRVRGILCHHCNLMLGNSKDTPSLLRKAAEYLENNK